MIRSQPPADPHAASFKPLLAPTAGCCQSHCCPVQSPIQPAACRELLEITEQVIRSQPPADPNAASIKQGATAFQLLQGAVDEDGSKPTMEGAQLVRIALLLMCRRVTSFVGGRAL